MDAESENCFASEFGCLPLKFLIYMTLNLDDLVVGKVVGTAALGLYQMAFTLSQLTTTQITTVINTVAFPTYSKLQSQPDRLRVAYVTTVQFVAFLSFPVAAGLWFVGEDLVQAFLGQRWLALVPAFEVLLIWGLIRSLLATTGPLLRGVGKPGLATRVQLVQLVLLAIAIYPLTSRYGIVGAGWATVAAAVIPDAWALYLAGRESSASLRSLGRVLIFPAANALLMIFVLYAIKRLWICQPVKPVGLGTCRRWPRVFESCLHLPALARIRPQRASPRSHDIKLNPYPARSAARCGAFGHRRARIRRCRHLLPIRDRR